MPKNKDMIYIEVFLVIVLAVWTALSLLPGPNSAQFSRDNTDFH